MKNEIVIDIDKLDNIVDIKETFISLADTLLNKGSISKDDKSKLATLRSRIEIYLTE